MMQAATRQVVLTPSRLGARPRDGAYLSPAVLRAWAYVAGWLVEKGARN